MATNCVYSFATVHGPIRSSGRPHAGKCFLRRKVYGNRFGFIGVMPGKEGLEIYSGPNDSCGVSQRSRSFFASKFQNQLQSRQHHLCFPPIKGEVTRSAMPGLLEVLLKYKLQVPAARPILQSRIRRENLFTRGFYRYQMFRAIYLIFQYGLKTKSHLYQC